MWKRLLGGAPPDRAEIGRIKTLTLGVLPAGTSVAVNEIVCRDPGCPGTETVILIMRAGARTVAAKIQKEAAEVSEDDVRAALAAQNLL
jgi:hypothetical protein